MWYGSTASCGDMFVITTYLMNNFFLTGPSQLDLNLQLLQTDLNGHVQLVERSKVPEGRSQQQHCSATEPPTVWTPAHLCL